jgi:hypothetical protein
MENLPDKPDHETKAVVCMLALKEANVRPHPVSRRWQAELSEAQIRDEIVREAMVRAFTRCNALGLGVKEQQTLLRGGLQRETTAKGPKQPSKFALVTEESERITEH